MSRRRRRSPAPRGHLRLMFAPRDAHAAARRSVRSRQSYQTPGARSRPGGRGGRWRAPRRARSGRGRPRPERAAATADSRRAASRSVAISYGSLRTRARSTRRVGRDELGLPRSVRGQRRLQPAIAVDGEMRRLEADPPPRLRRRAASASVASYEPSTVTSSRSGHSCARAARLVEHGDVAEVGDEEQAIGGQDDDRGAAGEVGEVEDVRQRGDDERVEPARRQLAAERVW